MMMKSFTSALLMVALIAVLASTTSAQTPAPASTVATSTSTSTTTAAAGTTTPAPTLPPSNYTGVPPGEFSTLLGVIATFVTGRASNPGFGATPTPTSAAASTTLVSAPTSVLMGLGLVMTTIVLTAVGTVGF